MSQDIADGHIQLIFIGYTHLDEFKDIKRRPNGRLN
jgi:hypothetical protein